MPTFYYGPAMLPLPPEPWNGIKAIVATDEAKLVEAGVEKGTARILVQNLNPEKRNEIRLIVVKDRDDKKALRVFSGYYIAEENRPAMIVLDKTVDLAEPKKTVDLGLNVIGLDNVPVNGRYLERANVAQLQDAIKRSVSLHIGNGKEISQSEGKHSGIMLSDDHSVKVPGTPLAERKGPALPGKQGGLA